MDIARAREALQDLLKSPNSTTSVRYYVKLALSHLEPDRPVVDADRRMTEDEEIEAAEQKFKSQ
jgi:hypothetical protein